MTSFKDNSTINSVQREQLLTVGDLIDFKEQLTKEIAKLLQQKVAEPTKRWLKSNEVRNILGLSIGKLQYLRNKGAIPFTKLGGVTYYDYHDIVKLMSDGIGKVNLKVT